MAPPQRRNLGNIEEDDMRTKMLTEGEYAALLPLLSGDNRLAVEVAAGTGLRIDDCLSLPAAAADGMISIRQQKTGKLKCICIPWELRQRLLARGQKSQWLFPSPRASCSGHRHRSTLYRAIRRAWLAIGGDPARTIAPHSLRKLYARRLYERSGCIELVQSALGHSSLATTLLYVFAPER